MSIPTPHQNYAQRLKKKLNSLFMDHHPASFVVDVTVADDNLRFGILCSANWVQKVSDIINEVGPDFFSGRLFKVVGFSVETPITGHSGIVDLTLDYKYLPKVKLIPRSKARR